jgi:hypothetical protein
LTLAYLTWHDDLQFHTFSWKWHNFIFLYPRSKIKVESDVIPTVYFVWPKPTLFIEPSWLFLECYYLYLKFCLT